MFNNLFYQGLMSLPKLKLGFPDLKQRWRPIKRHDSGSSTKKSACFGEPEQPIARSRKLSKPGLSLAVNISEEGCVELRQEEAKVGSEINFV